MKIKNVFIEVTDFQLTKLKENYNIIEPIKIGEDRNLINTSNLVNLSQSRETKIFDILLEEYYRIGCLPLDIKSIQSFANLISENFPILWNYKTNFK